jgi:HlyD family secretion protein
MKPNTDAVPPPKPAFRGNAAPSAHRRRRWPYVAGAVLISLIVIGLWPKPVRVETAQVRIAPLRVTVNDEGQTRVKHRYVVSSPIGGQLRRIQWKPGAVVEAGVTPLAYLEGGGADMLDARSLAQAEARVAGAAAAREQSAALDLRAKAAAELARSEAQRARQLFERGAMARQEFEQAAMRETAANEEARAAVFALQIASHEEQQARALLLRGQSKERSGEPVVVTSPVSGRVLRVFQESERLVSGGTPLLEVGDPTDLEIWVEVLSRDGVRIRPGAAVWLDQWGGAEPLKARVRLVEPSAWTKISALGVEEQRVWVIADFVDPVEKRPTLGDAYRVEARIVLWEGDKVLQAPAGALFQQKGSWMTYLVDGGRARMKPVHVDHSNGLWTEIADGLKEGDAVLVYPGDRVEDGVRVKVD